MILDRFGWIIAGVALVGLAIGVGGAAATLVHTSFGLTNPAGYQHHPGASQLPPGPDGRDPAADFGLDFQEVTFAAVDGSTLRGWLVPAPPDGQSQGRLGVVTVHGRGMDRRAFLPHLPMLHELGATTLLFDMREHGLSDGAERGMSMGYREAQDISAAMRYLKTTGVSQVVVLGMSLGAGSAIIAAAADPAIEAVIAESPYTSMEDYVQQMSEQGGRLARLPGLRLQMAWWPKLVVGFTAWRAGLPALTAPIDVIDKLAPRPLLLMHGTADTAFVPEHSIRLFSRAGMPKELWLAEGAEHTRIYEAYPAEYRQRVAAVLNAVRQTKLGSG